MSARHVEALLWILLSAAVIIWARQIAAANVAAAERWARRLRAPVLASWALFLNRRGLDRRILRAWAVVAFAVGVLSLVFN